MNKTYIALIIMVAVVVLVVIGIIFFLRKPDQPIPAVILDNPSSAERVDSKIVLNSEEEDQESEPVLDCTTWQERKYKAETELVEIKDLFVPNISHLTSFSDKVVSFSYPSDWELLTPSENSYRLIFPERGYVHLSISDDVDEYQTSYRQCLDRCFYDLFGVSWRCSEDYSEADLEKFLGGKYAYFINTGSMPANGSSSFIYRKVDSGKILAVSYSSEELIQLPKWKQFSEGHRDSRDFTEDELAAIEQERENFDAVIKEIFYTFKLHNQDDVEFDLNGLHEGENWGEVSEDTIKYLKKYLVENHGFSEDKVAINVKEVSGDGIYASVWSAGSYSGAHLLAQKKMGKFMFFMSDKTPCFVKK